MIARVTGTNHVVIDDRTVLQQTFFFQVLEANGYY
jgi:hypothetical protein